MEVKLSSRNWFSYLSTENPIREMSSVQFWWLRGLAGTIELQRSQLHCSTREGMVSSHHHILVPALYLIVSPSMHRWSAVLLMLWLALGAGLYITFAPSSYVWNNNAEALRRVASPLRTMLAVELLLWLCAGLGGFWLLSRPTWKYQACSGGRCRCRCNHCPDPHGSTKPSRGCC